MSDCLFCSISEGTIPADIVAETDDVIVFRDIFPQAPTHVQAIPRRHFVNLADMVSNDPELASKVLTEATRVATALGLTDGYSVVFNTGNMGGQSVPHVHAHVLGGRQMGWPPG